LEDIEKLGWKEGMELKGVAVEDKGYFLSTEK